MPQPTAPLDLAQSPTADADLLERARAGDGNAYLRAFTHLHAFRGDAALGTWLSRIAINISFDSLRKNGRLVQMDDEDMFDGHRALFAAIQTRCSATLVRVSRETDFVFRKATGRSSRRRIALCVRSTRA